MPVDTRQPADLLIAPRWLVPVEPAGAVLEHHAVVVTAGRISAVLPRAEALRRFDARIVIERPGHVLLPGLVNAHGHAAMTLLRGLADDLPLGDWLGRHVWPAENRWGGPEFVRDGTRLALLEMLGAGITCFSDMYYFPDVVAGLAVEHQVRAVIGMIVIEQPTPWATTTGEYFTKGLVVHDQYRGHPLVSTAFAPHAPYTVSDATLQRLRMLADELDVPVHMHVHETRAEVTEAEQRHGERPLARLDRLGLLSASFAAVHMTALDTADIDLVSERRASVVHCPSSNLKLASGLCPVAALAARGVNLALGTDGAASNNRLDLLGEMRLAALLAKAVSGDARALPAAEALAMATLGGARALGLAEDIGSIVPGKQADFTCIDLDGPATEPVHDVVSQLVYTAPREQVTDVWIAGRPVLADGRHTTIDATEVLARARAWAARMRSA
ncbi:MAG: TRZ/ATZ family hydrolase [Gammaproteobacteria bacterium]|nr:TRZ/ATZ family hydrolase [Gammaproteobacteria bacterium]